MNNNYVIMDYEKKYEEALERAKKWRNAPNVDKIPTFANRVIEEIFPELCESEDEKVRKRLIDFFEDWHKNRSHCWGIAVTDILAWLEKQGEPQDKGEISDGYHTFNELYYYRMLYNAAFFNMLPKEWVHKSKKHHDGEECFGGGWFIVMANLPTGQVSNHYELKDWDLFQIPEKEVADEWDGHTPQEAADRLHKYLLKKQGKNEEINEASYRAGIKRVLDNPESYGLEKQGNPTIKWNKNTKDNKPQFNHSVLMLTKSGISEGEWRGGNQWLQYRWSSIVRDSDVTGWMELSVLEKQSEQKPANKIEPKHEDETSIAIKNEEAYKIGFSDGEAHAKEEMELSWSEEDEKMIVRIRGIIEAYAFSQSAVDVNGDLCEKKFIDLDNWLKLLKERYTWKPSDEQMKNLSRAVNGGSYRISLLMELYQDLKKLKGE